MTLSKVTNEGNNKERNSWEQAIRDAEEEIRFLVRKKLRLEQAVRIFKANRRDGVPWPINVRTTKENTCG